MDAAGERAVGAVEPARSGAMGCEGRQVVSLLHLADDYGVRDITIGPVELRGKPATSSWTVITPCAVSWVNWAGTQYFTIPAGMDTDLASVPALFQSVVSPCGPIKEPAVLHDALYVYRPRLSTGVRITRSEADWILYVACKTIGLMDDGTCERVFLAVRVGGSMVWHRHDREFAELDAIQTPLQSHA